MMDWFGRLSSGIPMVDWNQHTLRNFIQAHFQPRQTQASPSWVNSVSFQPRADGTLLIQFPHTYFRDWFGQYLQKDFEAFIQNNFPGISGFVYQDQIFHHQHKESIFQPFQGDDRHTFKRFLCNEKNSQQMMAALSIINQSPWPSQSLLICGPPGCGKSHFLLAMANALLAAETSGPVLAITCEDLLSLDRLPAEDKERAKNEIRTAQAFFLDDVHRIDKSPALQDELLALYDALEEQGVPMVFTCLRKLSENGEVKPNLRSRLEGGGILHLKRLDLDIRLQFVQQETQAHGLHLPESDQLNLARQCQDFQSISHVLFKLLAQKDLRSSARKKDISEYIARSSADEPQPMTCEEIMTRVAEHFALPVQELTSHRRHQKSVLARQIAIYICRNLHHISFTQLGSLFGGRNHSSIIYAFKKIQSLQKERPEVKSQVQNLLKQCDENSCKTRS
jgi:chromosomal replication initiator protein